MHFWKRILERIKNERVQQQLPEERRPIQRNEFGGRLRKSASRHLLRRGTGAKKDPNNTADLRIPRASSLTLLPAFRFEDAVRDSTWVGPPEDPSRQSYAHDDADDVRLGEPSGIDSSSFGCSTDALTSGANANGDEGGPVIDVAWARLLQDYSSRLDLLGNYGLTFMEKVLWLMLLLL